MKLIEADVIWTPVWSADDLAKYPDLDGDYPGMVRVELHGSHWQRTRGDRWAQAATAWDPMHGTIPPKNNRTWQLLSMFILFNSIVVRDRVPVEDAHRAFLKIDEYRQHISHDIPEADRR
jgi:hypothetical protein